MSAHLNTTVGEIVAGNENAAQLFELVGIDYACHGNLSLRDACAEAGLDVMRIKRSVDQLPRAHTVNWLTEPIIALVHQLREVQNPSTTRSLAAAKSALDAPCTVCARYPAEGGAIAAAVDELTALLTAHMSREEHVLFPVLEHLDDCWRREERPSMELAGGVAHAVAAFVSEHSRAAEKLAGIRRIALALSVREPHCTRMLRVLHELDHAVREHIHIENNILYPRAAALECIVKHAPARSGRLAIRKR